MVRQQEETKTTETGNLPLTSDVEPQTLRPHDSFFLFDGARILATVEHRGLAQDQTEVSVLTRIFVLHLCAATVQPGLLLQTVRAALIDMDNHGPRLMTAPLHSGVFWRRDPGFPGQHSIDPL